MPVDARIPLAVRPQRPIEQPDIGRIMLTAGAIRGQGQQQELRDLQIQAAREEAAAAPEMRALRTRKERALTEQAEQGVDVNKLTLLEKQNNLIADTAYAVLQEGTQAAWDWGKQRLQMAGIDIGKVPLLWGEEAESLTKRTFTQAMGAKDIIRQNFEQLKLLQQQEKESYKRGQDERRFQQRERMHEENIGVRREGLALRRELAERKEKKEPTPQEAIKRITALRDLQRRIVQGGEVDANSLAMLSFMPKERLAALKELGVSMGGGADQEAVQRALEAIDAEIGYWMNKTPEFYRTIRSGQAPELPAAPPTQTQTMPTATPRARIKSFRQVR